MENEPCRRSSALQEPFHWKSAGGRPDVSPARKRTPSLSLSLSAALLEWSYSKRACSLKIWPSLNIEPTSSQISEETLESLKLRNSRKNSSASNNTEQPNQQKGIPRVTSRNDAWNSFNQPGNETTDQRHFNLKASIKQPLFRWNWSYYYK